MATSVSKLLIRLTKFSSKISNVIDATSFFNTTGTYYQDLSGWDYAIVQFVGISAEDSISFKTSNDNGSVTGQLLPAPEVPENWIAIPGVNLTDKTNISSISTDGLVQFATIGKYLLLEGSSINTPLSVAYVLSQNTYPTASEAYDLGVEQGTRIVYATTNTLSTANVLYSDSELTQPIYGDGTSWYGIALLTNNSVKYAITIDGEAVIVID